MVQDGEFSQVPAERIEVDGVPGLVGPSVFALEVVPKISPVDVEAKVGVEIPVVSDLVYGNGDLGSRKVSSSALRFSFAFGMKGGGESIDVDVDLCFVGQVGVRHFFVLVALYP